MTLIAMNYAFMKKSILMPCHHTLNFNYKNKGKEAFANEWMTYSENRPKYCGNEFGIVVMPLSPKAINKTNIKKFLSYHH